MKKIIDLTKEFKTNPQKLLNFYQNLFKKIKHNKKYNFVVNLYEEEIFQLIKDPEYIKKYQNKKLFGVPYFLKDNFNVKNKKTMAGSKILENFIPNFNSTVFQILKNEGAILLGKTVMDELGLGGTGLESKDGLVLNNLNPERITGGSSSGSAVAVSLGVSSFSIGSDTGDSVRKPASYLGIKGFKPSFGLISRYGLIPFSPSLDTVGFFSNHTDDLKLLTEILVQSDYKDFANQKKNIKKPDKNWNWKTKKVLFLNLNPSIVTQNNIDLFRENVILKFKKEGINYNFHELSVELIESLKFLYQIISFSEALSSQANLTGVNFGSLDFKKQKEMDFKKLIFKNRTKSFGWELKRRYVLGAYYSQGKNQEELYIRAMKMKTYLTNYFNKLFEKYDFIIHPATNDIAPKIEEIQNLKINPNLKTSISDFLLFANFLGLPSLSVPFASRKDLPLGLNIFAQFNQDHYLLEFTSKIEKIINYSKGDQNE